MEMIRDPDAIIEEISELLPASATEIIEGQNAIVQKFVELNDSDSSTINMIQEHVALIEEHGRILPGSGADAEAEPGSDSGAEEDWFPAYMARAPTSGSKKRIWELTDENEKKAEAAKFVQRVKERAENHQVYTEFLDIVSGYKKHKDVERVNREVMVLFERQPELHIEFTYFLVDAVEAEERRKKKRKARAVSEVVPAKKVKRRAVERGAPAEEKVVVYEEEDVCTDLVFLPPVCRMGGLGL